MEAERFLLKWNNHQSNLVTVFDQLYEQEAFTDVTLACDGRSFAAHKVILSACSPYFQNLFLSNPCKHPIIFMRDVRASDLDSLLAFMYRGEINVHQQDLSSFLKTAESLQIKGLSDSSEKQKDKSKILEAMQQKFCSNLIASGNNAIMPELPSAPPSKKPRIEDFPMILPKRRPLGTPPSLVPGLLTPITLATTVMKSGTQFMSHSRPPTPETTNSSPNTDASSPPKVKDCNQVNEDVENDIDHAEKSENFAENLLGNDSASAAAYLVAAAAAGMGTAENTPSVNDIKVEEEEHLEDNYSDYSSLQDIGEDLSVGSAYTEDALLSSRDKLTYPCRFCGKRFTQTGTCRRHERLHTSPNSFKCPFCNKGFNRKYRLKEHILSAHPMDAEDGDISLLVNSACSVP